jgi:hypothetical protein
VETLLRKYLWVLDGLVIAVVAILGARSVSISLAQSFLQQTSIMPHGRPSPPPPETSAPYAKTVELIVQRNIFCSGCRPPDASDGRAEAGPVGPQKTALPLKLMAIMFAPTPRSVRWTTAIIRDTALASAGPYRVGDRVHGATVTDIGETRLYLDNAGQSEFLDLIEGSPGAPEQPAAPSAPVALEAPARAAATPAPPPAVPARTALTAELFSVRGDRIKRHPH